MNKKRLILIIATIFSLLVSLPRVFFLMSDNKDHPINNVIEVSPEDTIIRILLLFSFSCAVLWLNMIGLNRFFEKRRRIIAAFISNPVLLGIWILIFQLTNEFVYNINSSVIHPRVNTLVYFFFLILLVLISTAINLINKSRVDEIEKQVLKQKSLQNELEALKNQINPHFFFNSLNTLSLLVREDQKAAGKFINKLSFLFRYILQSQDKELASVKEELKVLESYIHLIQQRYQGNFVVDIDIKEQLLQRHIPILSLQLLLENAIKHNEISDNKPLRVEIYDEYNFIVVKNMLQKRRGNIESTHKGLKNLSTRTLLKTNKEIQILRSENHFAVKVPMI